MDHDALIHRYLLGVATEADVQQLDFLLSQQPELRRQYVVAATTDAGLREIALEQAADSPLLPRASRSKGSWMWATAGLIAAAVLLVVILRPLVHTEETVAMLVSSENAAWESVLPTVPGAHLTAGELRLKSGIATLRFPLGAEIILEAPARLELVSATRCRLLDGVALVEVPESAVGFVVETPSGYAIDYGTRFAVNVDSAKGESDFELIEGEIGVHHAATGEEIRLTQPHKGVTASAEAFHMLVVDEPDEVAPSTAELVRIGTAGRATSVLPNDKRHKYIDPEVLSVKKTENGKWDYRSFFAFDVADVDFGNVTRARLRLNLVPSRRGLASRLPPTNQFGVYGLTDADKADWTLDAKWEDAPAPEDGVLLGTFEIPRSTQRGSFGIANEELLEFLKTNSRRTVTLILVRLTTQTEGEGPGLTHMFASDSHPEAVGPLLELTLNDTTQR